jgi:(4S)-4-hydroxy-5-phosphonooxypentane-2,3-dione isomerase
MVIIQVFVHVKPEYVTDFVGATMDNATASLAEPGVARFDVLQQQDDPTRFTLIEAYRDAEAPSAHKATAHYARWRDAVEPMMAEPRRSLKYSAVHYPG